MARPLKAIIDLEAIKTNYQFSKKLHPTCKALAVVKSDAYGHGAVDVATYLDDDVDAFAVAAIEEALQLREADVTSPILLLEGVFEQNEWPLCEELGFWCVIENTTQLDGLLNAQNKIEKVFVKLDTGMHRLGLNSLQVVHVVDTLKASGLVEEVVLMTHFSCADDLSSLETIKQLTLFEEANRTAGHLTTSVANSAAIMKWSVPEGGWIRPGIMLYGISPFVGVTGTQLGLKPAMQLVSKVISVRDVNVGDTVGYSQQYTAEHPHQIATVAVGYGDGYPRSSENGTPVALSGDTAELAGRVSMDMITVKLSNQSSSELPHQERNIQLGEEVELWGEQVPVEEVAYRSGTIGYELVTRMTQRPMREYKTTKEQS
ncbi:alanine racemase [Marinomonas mediterranea]|uniref:alanine racemase n=1 Tax=Marinomonas mediterranea TaxID=119864 RepID=UPI00234B32ED|nr:alanine racemase [Marinomonas mediterranea]WCN08098.1 alanine racemase [Marinomonas mediterranea]